MGAGDATARAEAEDKKAGFKDDLAGVVIR
jgi:hypothetical protein